uniref:Acetyl-coenzyme A transporter 1 n=1 Tax=Plectus sambesii TaxID=2011161 RepID=A0A914W828_9BILA
MDGDLTRRTRSRQRSLRSSDLMAAEPEFATMDSGPHVPSLYRSKRRPNRGQEAEEALLGEEEEMEDGTLPRSTGRDSSVRRRGNWWQSWQEDLRGDFSSIFLLLFLYLLQGIPLGLIASIPLVLQSRHVTYAQQAIFSLAYWPFSLKLFWAPIVDSCFIQRLGRRKSWLVPTQYLIGIFMLVLSSQVTYILGDSEDGSGPNVTFLMLIFLPLNFLAATQDIAVDGWALTILSRKNVGYASTCNAVGQTAGFFLGNVVFLSLESAEFCNSYIRTHPQPYGIVTLADFVYFWGWIFMITTTLVLVFKHEVDHSVGDSNYADNEGDMGVVDAYKLLYTIMKLKPVLILVVILLTGKLAFAATDGMTGLKLIEMGVPKAELASMGLFLTPVQVLLPWLIGRYTAGPKPLNVYLRAYPYRIIMGAVFAVLIWWTPSFKTENGSYSKMVYVVWVVAYALHQVATYSIFVSMMAFYAQISDPKVGGTYMTLLNTLNNLGGNWPVTLMLSIADYFNWKGCIKPGSEEWLGACNTKELEESCTAAGNVCSTSIDSYYVLVTICSVLGFLWWKLMYRRINRLQDIDRREWSCMK